MIDTEALQNLHQLKSDGIISEAEFEQAKQRILFGQKGRAPPVIPSRPSDQDAVAWVLLPLRRYADFTGRSSRKEFWMFQLLYVAVGFGLFVGISAEGDSYGEPGILARVAFFTAIAAALGLIVPQLALEARRFHDQGKSGWLVLINLIPYVGFIIVYAMMLVEGTKGENLYGPDPLAD